MKTVDRWSDYLDSIAIGLQRLVVTDGEGRAMSPSEGFVRWVAMTQATNARGGSVYIIGNGGSAGIASHMATDALKNGRLRAMAFNDAALLTATANDLCYDEVFSLPLSRMARHGDLLISISSSGNSANIVRAIETARASGLQIVTLSGMRADNRSRALGTLNLYVPLERYGWTESAHQIILHYWFDRYLHEHGGGPV